MFHKILVAMDRSVIGQQVFDEALSLAKATGAK
jgi:nucleotide-binding universal stress UspA family protein